MENILLIIHLVVALALVGIILLQKSEGGALGIGGPGGGGGMGSIFSARGVGNALTRMTAFLAVAFFVTSVALTLIATRGKDLLNGGSVFDNVPAQEQTTSDPAKPAEGGSVLPKLEPAQPQVPTNQ